MKWENELQILTQSIKWGHDQVKIKEYIIRIGVDGDEP